jgi:lipoyl-dependent peroxiredoxin
VSGEPLTGAARVVWRGGLEQGSGALRLELGAGGELPLVWPGSAAFGPGATDPEELAAAAYAACFTMTLAYSLSRTGHPPTTIATEATVSFGVVDRARRIRSARLDLTVDAAGLSERELLDAAEVAGRHCPVSNTLRVAGVELDVRAQLAGGVGRA